MDTVVHGVAKSRTRLSDFHSFIRVVFIPQFVNMVYHID